MNSNRIDKQMFNLFWEEGFSVSSKEFHSFELMADFISDCENLFIIGFYDYQTDLFSIIDSVNGVDRLQKTSILFAFNHPLNSVINIDTCINVCKIIKKEKREYLFDTEENLLDSITIVEDINQTYLAISYVSRVFTIEEIIKDFVVGIGISIEKIAERYLILPSEVELIVRYYIQSFQKLSSSKPVKRIPNDQDIEKTIKEEFEKLVYWVYQNITINNYSRFNLMNFKKAKELIDNSNVGKRSKNKLTLLLKEAISLYIKRMYLYRLSILLDGISIDVSKESINVYWQSEKQILEHITEIDLSQLEYDSFNWCYTKL